MIATASTDKISWEIPPKDFILDDEPVDNVNQPPLAAALTESLELAGKLPKNALVTTNYGLCATVNHKIIVKAPDWCYINEIRVPRAEVKRSYTPNRQGDVPLLVMEFLSDTDGGEYSSKQTYPLGKWFFYEQILQIPNYIIFAPETSNLEVHRLEDGQYKLSPAGKNNRYWLEVMNLWLGVWQGTKENRQGYWLRWWDEQGNLLLWGSELVQKERQAKEDALKRLAELEQKLRDAGI
jgi:Uma2 family endonuclease